MHSSLDVANKILELAEAKGDTVTPMQLLKLVYLCHGWMLGMYGVHLIKDEIEAWRYGPVIPELYQEIKSFRSNPVIGRLRSYPKCFTALEENLIEQVYEGYGKYTGIQLSSLTHMEESPWWVTWKNEGKNAVISNDLIEDYYRKLSQQPK